MLSYQPSAQSDVDASGYGSAISYFDTIPPKSSPKAGFVEQLLSHSRVVCRCQGLLLHVVTGQILPLWCKSWLCPRCGPRKVASYVMRVSPHPWLWFLTLTLEGNGNPERQTFSRLAKGWKHVRQYLKRHGMTNYTWVREQGHNATKRVHLHVIFDGPRQVVGCSLRCAKPHKHVRGMRRAVERSGLGIWFKLQAVRSQKHVKRYVTKYLSKDIANWRWPKGTRRCQTTIPRFRDEGWILLCPPQYKKWTWYNSNIPNPELYLTKMEKGIQPMAPSGCVGLTIERGTEKQRQVVLPLPREVQQPRAME